MNHEAIVVANRLTKHFREVKALSDFSIQVSKGQVVGLLGPNGSGKSTFVRLLMGFLTPSSGEAKIMGLNCSSQRIQVHQQVSYLPGDARLFRTMRGKDVFDFFGKLHGKEFITRADSISKRLDLDLNRWVAFMSTGMRQKLALSIVLALDTPLIILDEPTSNLDPSVRSEVLSLVSEAQRKGKTILFSSHVLSEIEEVCDRVVILRGGKLVHAETLEFHSRRHQVKFQCEGAVPAFPPSWAPRVTGFEIADNQHQLILDGNLPPLLEWLSDLPIEQLSIQPVNLRSVYDQFHQAEV